ncbi:hypothetical protein ACFQX7_23350 [Luedemannella flava]
MGTGVRDGGRRGFGGRRPAAATTSDATTLARTPSSAVRYGTSWSVWSPLTPGPAMRYATAMRAGPPSPETATASLPEPPNLAIMASVAETSTTSPRVVQISGSLGSTNCSGTARRASGHGSCVISGQMIEPAANSHTHTAVVMMLPATGVQVSAPMAITMPAGTATPLVIMTTRSGLMFVGGRAAVAGSTARNADAPPPMPATTDTAVRPGQPATRLRRRPRRAAEPAPATVAVSTIHATQVSSADQPFSPPASNGRSHRTMSRP